MNPLLFVTGWRMALVWIFFLTVVPPALLWLAFDELRAAAVRAPRVDR